MSVGHGCIPYTQFLGYDKGADGGFVINEEQTRIVKRIFNEYLDGMNTSQIARGLSYDGIKTVTGKDRWHPSTIRSILSNEKYVGDCLMQKYYTSDFLTKKQVKNQGELEQYYVKDHHEPIVSREVYTAAQRKLRSNQNNNPLSSARDFSSMMICGDCGSYYGSKVWHSNRKYRKVVYQCNAFYKGDKCNTPVVSEERLKEMFVEAINELLVNKDEIIGNLERLLAIKAGTDYDEKIRKTAVALDEAEKAYRDMINKQKMSPVPFEEYEKNLTKIAENYDEARKEHERVMEESRSRTGDIYLIRHFIQDLEEQEGIVAEYDFGLMKRTVNQITIYQDRRAVFEFLNGSEITVMI